jgi:hypothetical protein
MTEQTGNPDPGDQGQQGNPDPSASQGNEAIAWQDRLGTDLKNSPQITKFGNDADGLNAAMESYANLEKLIGHEKVPIPKGDDDTEGWDRFSKAMGIPSKAEEYGLPDASLPESMKGMTMDKARFAEVAHSFKLTPNQAQGLWNTYQEINVNAYNQAMRAAEEQMTDTINKLKGEWGDAYDTNVELGQMVINKFAADQDANDFITATVAKDPRGVRFLAKIGEQFAENKFGGAEFQMKRFSMAPEEAAEEVQKIIADPNHPYKNPKATDKEHDAAVDYVNRLIGIANRGKGQS